MVHRLSQNERYFIRIKKMNEFKDLLLTLKGVIQYNRFLKYSQHYNHNDIQTKKNEWLNILLRHCRENIPWYSSQFRRYGVKIDTDNPFSELNKLPYSYKRDCRRKSF
jgi:phenylacetate-coenzyme A ligase PaaK-like adenylate-forming protein